MQQIIQQAIEEMVRLGNELNWNEPIDYKYVNAVNELRALRDAIQHCLQPTAGTCPHLVAEFDYLCSRCGKLVPASGG